MIDPESVGVKNWLSTGVVPPEVSIADIIGLIDMETMERSQERRLKQRTRQLTRDRVSAGHLEKKETCKHCGAMENVQAHHLDYSDPSDVQWLCYPCHNRLHHPLTPQKAKVCGLKNCPP